MNLKQFLPTSLPMLSMYIEFEMERKRYNYTGNKIWLLLQLLYTVGYRNRLASVRMGLGDKLQSHERDFQTMNLKFLTYCWDYSPTLNYLL